MKNDLSFQLVSTSFAITNIVTATTAFDTGGEDDDEEDVEVRREGRSHLSMVILTKINVSFRHSCPLPGIKQPGDTRTIDLALILIIAIMNVI